MSSCITQSFSYMKKTIFQTVSMESVDISIQGFIVDYLPVAQTINKAPEISSIYDDEIGLWEELLHRGDQSKLDSD